MYHFGMTLFCIRMYSLKQLKMLYLSFCVAESNSDEKNLNPFCKTLYNINNITEHLTQQCKGDGQPAVKAVRCSA